MFRYIAKYMNIEKSKRPTFWNGERVYIKLDGRVELNSDILTGFTVLNDICIRIHICGDVQRFCFYRSDRLVVIFL